jgi:predicted DsbA family dithiol-disulfide isomerase
VFFGPSSVVPIGLVGSHPFRRGLCDAAVVQEPLRIRVYHDFASSLAYVAHRVMERMTVDLDELGLALDWLPLDLSRITGWPRGAPVEGPRRANVLRVARELSVPVRMPGHWTDSRAANALALTFAGTPREPAWRERVYSAIHEEGRCIEDADVLASLARDLGVAIDPDREALRLAELERVSLAARAEQVTGVPTFMLGGWPVGGIQEDSVMRSLLGRWAEKARRPEGD